MKLAYITRGVSGSGKSTVAKQLASGSGGKIHSTDNFFYVDGEYRFDARKLSEYHERNFRAFCQSLRDGVPVVICDNTNARRWQFEGYVDAARRAGYLVAIVTLPHPDVNEAAQRNAHSVPAAAIRRMIDEWED